MFRLYCFILTALMLSACATTHSGPIAESKEKSVVISVDENTDLSDKYYLFLEYTIENTSTEWKDIQIVDVDFRGQETEVLVDEQLSSWIEGAEHKLKAAQYNQDLLIGSMVLAGGIVAGTSSSNTGKVAGAATMVGAAAVGVGTDISRAKNQASSGAKGENGTVNVPKTHIFVPSKIAPESYIRRWIVLKAPQLPKPKASENELSYQQEDTQTVYTYKLISKAKINTTQEADYASEHKFIQYNR
jgi:hypothetical protein